MAYTFRRHQNGPAEIIMADHINELQEAIEDLSQLKELNDHIADQENPHAVTKAQIGLGNVDNTSDLDKPISRAMQTALDAKSDVTHNHDAVYAPLAHGHAIADVTGLQAALDGKSATGHTHDDRYYTETEIDTALAAKANVGHGHAIADVTGLQAALDGKAAKTHGHVIADVSGLQAALDGKAAANHNHDTVYAPLSHTSDKNNPHGVTKAQVGLGNVPNVDATNRANHTGTQPSSTISDFASAVDARIDAKRGAINGLAPLDSAGRIPSSHLPPIAMTDVNVVSSETAQLALTGQQEGDVVIRTDLNKTFIHNGGTTGTMADWSEMVTPADGVLSVNGQAGPTVNLTTSHISEGSRLYYTDERVSANPTVAANTAARHTHSNKATLDATTAAFTTDLKSKLDGIEAGADKTTTAKVDAAGAVMVTDTSTSGMGFVVDETNLISNSATKVPTQRSVKAYVDAGLATKAAASHTHAISEIPNLQTTLDGKAAASHTHAVSDVTNFAETVRDTIAGALVAGSNVSIVHDDPNDTITISASLPTHNHDDRYYTETEMDTLLAGKANASHTHSASQITSGVFDIARIPTGTTGTTVALGNHTHSQYALTSHTHTASQVTDFEETVRDTVGATLKAGANVSIAVDDINDTITISSAVDMNHTHDDRYYTETETNTLLAGKADVGHTHAIADVTGLQTALDGKAASSHSHSATDITSGTLNIARIPTGTTSSTVALGNHTHSQYALTSHNHDGVYAPASHTHTSGQVTDFAEAVRDTMGLALKGGSNVTVVHDDANDTITISSSLPSHNHDDRYYTETEMDTLLGAKANTSHTHSAADITSGTLSIARIPTGTTSSTVALGNHTHSNYALTTHNHDGVYAPASHTHDDRYYTESEVDTKLAGKANTSHTHDDRYYTETEVDTKIEAAKTDSNLYVQSRVANLITNGSGLLGNNTNFSRFTFDPTETYSGGGSFKAVGRVYNNVTDEFIPVDPNKTYILSVWMKTTSPGTINNRIYYGFHCYDIDKNEIGTYSHMRRAGTDTRLTQDLKPGDTVIHVASVANWYTGTTTSQRSVVVYGYANSYGYVYPDYTYSRRYVVNAYGENGIDPTTNTITLSSPWPSTWGVIPAGTAISNCLSGGTYKYNAASNRQLPTQWTYLEGRIEGTDLEGKNAVTKFSPGTAYIKPIVITDYAQEGGVTTNLSMVSLYEDAFGAVAHSDRKDNPHNVTKAQVGLANVDNTSDLDKPISRAVQTALDGKANASHSHAVADVTGLQTALDGKAAAAHTHAIADIDATGTKSSSTYLRGDGTWATPPNTTYSLISQAEAENASSTTARLVSGQRLYQAVQMHAPVKATDLATKADVGHSHAIGDVANLQTTLDGKANATHTHAVTDLDATGTRSSSTYLRGDGTWATPTNTTYSVMSQAEAEAGTATTGRVLSAVRLKDTILYHAPVKPADLATKADLGHIHAISDVSGLQTALDGKAAAGHGHLITDITDLQAALDGKASAGHSHLITDITDLQAALDDKAAAGHGHAIADVSGLQAALDGKAASSHNHDASNITSGTLNIARIPTGTTSSTVALGNHTHSQYALTSHTHTVAQLGLREPQTYVTYAESDGHLIRNTPGEYVLTQGDTPVLEAGVWYLILCTGVVSGYGYGQRGLVKLSLSIHGARRDTSARCVWEHGIYDVFTYQHARTYRGEGTAIPVIFRQVLESGANQPNWAKLEMVAIPMDVIAKPR